MTERVDVAIIGGGFAGCATARALAAHGVRARVIEREAELGHHASGRGAGLGRQLAEDDVTSALTVRGVQLLRERYPAAWTETGGILTFDDPEHAQAYIARARRLDVAHEVIEHARVLARWPQLSKLRIAAAIHVQRDGVIEIRALLAALAEGLDISRATHVVRISDGTITTSHGAIEARVVVDAAGAWAGQATDDPPLEVYKRHLFTLEAAVERGPFLWHLGHEELYLRADTGGVLASPCDADPTTPHDQEPDADADARLRERLAALSPVLAAAPITRRWACQRAFTADRQTRVGRDPRRPWLVWAAGLGGHGATASVRVGELAATAALEALR